MKMGDSLGRNRKRRKKKTSPLEHEAAASDDLGATEPESDLGADAEVTAAGATDAGVTDTGSTGPGEPSGASLSEPPSDSGGSAPARRPSPLSALGGRRLWGAVGALAVLGWFFGYALATQIVFPAPPPPRDLMEVPDLRGLGLASANERLAGAGLGMGVVDSLLHPSVAAGVVLGQSPLPGQVASPDQDVRVTISAGPQMRSVPDVRRLERERARVVLETSGFVVSFDTVESTEARGRVVDVDPAPDSVVALPAQIRLVVSTGPPVISMPLVLGLEQAEAEFTLDSLGLTVTDVEEVFRFGRDQGIVVEQQPAADTELERGSSVRLKVGRRGIGREQ